MPTLAERFESKYVPEPNSGCWLWTGALSTYGYGVFWNGGRTQDAHRVSYELHRGPIPQGLQLDHLCRIRSCVNPWHLEAVTQTTNVLRGKSLSAVRARQTHCKRGHEFTPENTRIVHGGRGRECRICSNENARARWARARRD